MGKSKDLASGAAYQDQTESDTRYVNTAGDSMTGELLVRRARSNTAGDAALTIHPSDTTVSYGMRIDQNTNSLNFDQVNSGVTRMSIDSAGRVTKPSQPSFSAYLASNYTTTASGWQKLLLNGTRWNTGSHYSTSNHRFTAPVAGVYHFTGGVNRYWLPAGTLFRAAFYVNGSKYVYGHVDYSYGTSDLKYLAASTIKLDANDYIEFWSYTNTTTNNGFSGGVDWNTFSGFLVG